jgi:parallel beta-helix repeat protein
VDKQSRGLFYRGVSLTAIIGIVLAVQLCCVLGYDEIITFDINSTYSLDNCSRIMWYPDIFEGNSSPPALRSGPIKNSGKSCVEKVVDGPAYINFLWKIDHANGRIGELSFIVDNETILVCPSSSWSPASYAISSGNHTLSWEYRKQYSYPEFVGAGWIDDLKIVSSRSVESDTQSRLINLTCANVNWTVNQDFSQNVTCLEENITRINEILDGINRRIDNIDLINGKDLSNLTKSIERINDNYYNISQNISDIESFLTNESCWLMDEVIFIPANTSNLSELISNTRNKIFILDNGLYPTNCSIINSSNIYIKSLHKWGAKLDAEGMDDGIYLNEVNNVTIDSVIIANCTEGVHIENSSNCQFINNLISDFDLRGIKLWNCTQCMLLENTLLPRSNINIIGIKLNLSDDNILMLNRINVDPSCKSSYSYQVLDSKGNCIYVSENGRIWENGIDRDAGQKVNFYCEIRDCQSGCWLFDEDTNPSNDPVLNSLSSISNNIWNFGY